MNAPERFLLPDIQSVSDDRRIAINRVGVKGMLHPLRIRTAAGDDQHTVAQVDMYVGLPDHVKGTHMSRFVEVLQAHHGALDHASFRALTVRMMERLEADALRLNRDERVRAYVLESENFESIHNHSAYALVERDKDREQTRAGRGEQPFAGFGSPWSDSTS